jgi:DNA-binding CsgD family transcriptional regulator
MTTLAEVLSIVEATYSLEASATAWLEALAEATRLVLDQGLGVFAFVYDATSDDWIRIEAATSAELSDEFRDAAFNVTGMPASEIRTLARGYRTKSVTSAIDFCTSMPHHLAHYTRVLPSFGCKDLLFFNGIDPSARSVTLVIPQVHEVKLRRRQSTHFARLAAHLGAGFRVRQQLASLTAGSLEQSAGTEAILEPNGKLQHAVGPASEIVSRQRLQQAVVQIERARGRMRRSDPEAALQAWQALIDGRWSLLEEFDHDGRRYIFAHRNDPRTPDLRGLSDRERQVVAYALLGHSNKHIGYELGLAPSTVALHLGTACKKLGCLSRVELIQRFSNSLPAK